MPYKLRLLKENSSSFAEIDLCTDDEQQARNKASFFRAMIESFPGNEGWRIEFELIGPPGEIAFNG